MRDVPGVYPFFFVGFEFLALAISGATNHLRDSNILMAGHVLLSVSLCALAYTIVNQKWDNYTYHANTISSGVLYGLLIGEHDETHIAELLFVFMSFSSFLVCYVGVARKMDLLNVAAAEDIERGDTEPFQKRSLEETQFQNMCNK